MIAAVKVVGMVAGGRQHIVAHASVNDPVLLVPEPDNPYDANAIAVYTAPRSALQHPDEVVSSLRADDRVGKVHAEDRMLLMDRQAGYVPKDFAARFALPAAGLVGYIAEVRMGPLSYGRDGAPLDPVVAGFDVVAKWPTDQPAVGDDPDPAQASIDAALDHDLDAAPEAP